MIGGSRFRQPLARFGHFIGMAFQIADDLLDYAGTEAATGKPVGQDLREHKMTLPLIVALGAMDGTARRDVEHFFAEPEPSDDGIRHVIRLVHDHGGLDHARARADEFAARAAEALQKLPPSDAAAALEAAISYVVDRRR
jgi:octaprenyl-diphosphate synthase